MQLFRILLTPQIRQVILNISCNLPNHNFEGVVTCNLGTRLVGQKRKRTLEVLVFSMTKLFINQKQVDVQLSNIQDILDFPLELSHLS